MVSRADFGISILNGTGAPDDSVGFEGDFYIDLSVYDLWGPKGTISWPVSGVSLVGPTGPTGPAGPTGVSGVNFIGAWSSGQTYANNDVLTYLGSAYVVANATTVNANNTSPPISNDSDPYSVQFGWVLFAVEGAAGPTGPTGPTGPAGADGRTVLYGSGAPSNGTGIDGDFYIEPTLHFIYGPKASGTWPAGTSLIGPAGAAGVDGKTILSGSGDPLNSNGVNGDYYYDSVGHRFWGPKAAGAWSTYITLSVLLSGTGSPSAGLGVNGDFYIDSAATTLYGPKSGGAWPVGISLIGPVGATGPTGATGATGPAGPTGPQGNGLLSKYVTADVTTTSTSAQNVTDLTIAITAGTWAFRAAFFTTTAGGSSAANFGAGITGPAASAVHWTFSDIFESVDKDIQPNVKYLSSYTTVTTSVENLRPASVPGLCVIEGIIVATASGNLVAQYNRIDGVGGTPSVTVKIGSYLNVWQIT